MSVVIAEPPAEPSPQFGAGLERVQVNAFVLQRPPKPLRKNTLSIQRLRPSMLIRTSASRNMSVKSALVN